MKKSILITLCMMLGVTFSMSANNTDQIHTKDGVVYEGYISEQYPGKYISIYAERTTMFIPSEEVKNIKYITADVRNLKMSIKEWMAENRPDEESVRIASFKWKNLQYSQAIVLERGHNMKFVCFAEKEVKVEWKNIHKTTKTPGNFEAEYGTKDVITLKNGKRFEGYIIEQLMGKETRIMTAPHEVNTIKASDILSIRSELLDPHMDLWSQVRFIDRIELSDGRAIEGFISSRVMGSNLTIVSIDNDEEIEIPLRQVRKYFKFPNEGFVEWVKPAAVEEEVQPVVEEAPAVVQEVKPVVEKAQPVVQEVKPAVAEAPAVVEEVKPTVVEAPAVVEEAKPVVEEVKPAVVEEAKPVVEEVKPAVVEEAPAPVAQKPTPEPTPEVEKVEQTKPSTKKTNVVNISEEFVKQRLGEEYYDALENEKAMKAQATEQNNNQQANYAAEEKESYAPAPQQAPAAAQTPAKAEQQPINESPAEEPQTAVVEEVAPAPAVKSQISQSYIEAATTFVVNEGVDLRPKSDEYDAPASQIKGDEVACINGEAMVLNEIRSVDDMHVITMPVVNKVKAGAVRIELTDKYHRVAYRVVGTTPKTFTEAVYEDVYTVPVYYNNYITTNTVGFHMSKYDNGNTQLYITSIEPGIYAILPVGDNRQCLVFEVE